MLGKPFLFPIETFLISLLGYKRCDKLFNENTSAYLSRTERFENPRELPYKRAH
ncbi:hypothetical protein M5D96_005194 [Drosophila gunungcola]|uniref:Uncharacterized protein n=1 Tax=Drosophila gunungcola TaxID=103775 RepID=A0A9P9YVI0_9MUSC|nr:hypothetical protein M5D96_005194 [Drosophila gunungcola]